MSLGELRTMFEVIPAIDLRGGKCVRLFQGDYSLETVFSEDPVGVARDWERQGAPRIHVVDLDGAARGEPVSLDQIEGIVKAVGIPVQVGGGVRRLDTVEKLLSLGAQRVVLGTVAVDDPELVAEACRRFGQAIVVGVDARDGWVAVRGWKERSQVTASELVQRMEALGVARIIYTDIARDGALSGPNLEAIASLKKETTLPIIASGGVASLEHLKELAKLGVEGAIVGRALYTGAVDLKEAVRITK